MSFPLKVQLQKFSKSLTGLVLSQEAISKLDWTNPGNMEAIWEAKANWEPKV